MFPAPLPLEPSQEVGWQANLVTSWMANFFQICDGQQTMGNTASNMQTWFIHTERSCSCTRHRLELQLSGWKLEPSRHVVWLTGQMTFYTQPDYSCDIWCVGLYTKWPLNLSFQFLVHQGWKSNGTCMHMQLWCWALTATSQAHPTCATIYYFYVVTWVCMTVFSVRLLWYRYNLYSLRMVETVNIVFTTKREWQHKTQSSLTLNLPCGMCLVV